MTLDEFNEAKRIIGEASKKKERALGAMAQLLADLRNEFECKTLEAASKKLDSIIAEITKMEKKLKSIIEKLEKFDV